GITPGESAGDAGPRIRAGVNGRRDDLGITGLPGTALSCERRRVLSREARRSALRCEAVAGRARTEPPSVSSQCGVEVHREPVFASRNGHPRASASTGRSLRRQERSATAPAPRRASACADQPWNNPFGYLCQEGWCTQAVARNATAVTFFAIA